MAETAVLLDPHWFFKIQLDCDNLVSELQFSPRPAHSNNQDLVGGMQDTFILISRPSHLTVVILDSLAITGRSGTHGNFWLGPE